MTPFMIAVLHGREKVAEILLENGADVNACIRVESPKSTHDKSPKYAVGTTALRMAAEKGDIPMVQFLLNHEASIAEDTHGATPLDYLWGKASLDVIRTLIEGGCSPHHVLKMNGYTALHMVSQNPDLNIFRMLVTEYHVNPNQKDSKGNYAINFIQDLELLGFLLDNNAEVDNATLNFSSENCQWEKLILLLKRATIVTQEMATSKEDPFACFARKINILRHEYEEVEPRYVLEITTLFLEKGGKITPDMNRNFKDYFSFHRAFEDQSEFQQLKKLVNENSPSSAEAIPSTHLLKDESSTNSFNDRPPNPKCVIA